MRLVDGAKLGGVGRLRLEGLQGDVLTRFSLRRLSVVDAQGAWLEARDVELVWRPFELFDRRVHAERLGIGDLIILRRPVIESRPKGPSSEGPVSVRLDALVAHVETRPAFSDVAGDWTVGGALDYARSGRAVGRLRGASRVHAGDGVTLDFTLGPAGRLSLAGQAVEAQGGALAGALGLSATAPFRVSARAEGREVGGEFSFDARSGAVRPLVAHGGWSPAGGVIEARVALGASRLTHYFADHIGPELTLAITAHARPDGLYAIRLDARGAKAQAQAVGPFDLRRRRTPGLDLALQVADLTVWSHPLQVGPAHARGVFVGDLTSFAYRGALAGERLVQSGYTLARVEGPAFVTHGVEGWTFGGDLQGREGGGERGARLLLGAGPRLKIAGSFDPARRLEFHDLHLTGAEITVDAQGSQPWRGVLNFAGRASAPDLGFLRPGARGRLDATWRAAAQPRDPIWRFDAQVRGQSVATGVTEVDRLLGAAPAMKLSGSYVDGAFTFASVTLAAANLEAHARGVLGRASALGFDLDWSAQGPFAAGPVEVAGRLAGQGRLEGTLAAPRAALGASIASLDLGPLRIGAARLQLDFAEALDGWTGHAGLTGSSAQGPASARADFRLSKTGVDLQNLAADAGGVKLAGAIALHDAQPSSADLTLSATPGAFLGDGRLNGRLNILARAGGAVASARFQGADLAPPGGPRWIHRLALSAEGPLDRLPLHVSLDAETPFGWRFAGDGLLTRSGQTRELDLSGAGRVRSADFHTLAPLRVSLQPEARALEARLAIAGGTAAISGRQTSGPAAGLTLRAGLSGIDLAVLSQDYLGKLTAALELGGTGAALDGRLDANLTDARTRDAAPRLAMAAQAQATLHRGALDLHLNIVNAQGLRAQGAVDLPARAAAAPFALALDPTRPIRGDFDARGELRPLWDLFTGGERVLSGELAAHGSLSGTLRTPDVAGAATLAHGAFRDAQTGLVLQKLAVQADFGHNQIQIRQFSGDDGRGGALAGAGEVGLARDGASTFRLRLTRFQLLDDELGRATASGALDVTREASGRAKLTGRLTLDHAEITTKTPTPSGAVAMEVEEINLPLRQGEAPTVRNATAGLVVLDVGIAARGGVLVRGKGIDAELSLDAHVGGSTATPDLTGEAHVVRGTFDFSGKRFDFDTGGSIRLASKPEHIQLDLKAERNDPALDAVVRVRGTAARPEITLTSQPVLPQDEILSRVLFGVSASQLSAYQAAELATALAGLATGGGFDVLANLRQFAGLDRLTLGGDASGPAISGGKYLTKDIYLELTGAAVGRSQTATTAAQIARTGPSAEVEWRIRRNLSLVSQVWAGGDAQLSVRFRRDY